MDSRASAFKLRIDEKAKKSRDRKNGVVGQ